jgi:predicted lipoprotein with Yx(FWY)xxD motif
MKRSSTLIVTIIVLVVLVGGAYALFHKSPKAATTSSSTTSSTQSTTPAVNNAVLITKTASGIGQYLADPSGKALYTFGGDTSGVSNCTGSCLADWPAYQDKGPTTGLPAGVSTITRTDNGQVQYTYMGKPLYYFVSDSQGKVTGNGDDNFSVAKPAAANTSQTPSSSNTNSSASSNSSNYGNPY